MDTAKTMETVDNLLGENSSDTWERFQNDVNIDTENLSEIYHTTRIAVKGLCRQCEENGIPIFVAYYLPEKGGYNYQATFPEEIASDDVQSEYGKFKEFLKVCMGFNKQDYFPQIH